MSAEPPLVPWLAATRTRRPREPCGSETAQESRGRLVAMLSPQPPPDGHSRQTRLPADTLGLALSGGGIRSAAFCLGVIQALARAGWLRRVDFLSTVSGGGYIGAFLGRFFDQCAEPDGLTGAVPEPTRRRGQDRVARDLTDSRSAPVDVAPPALELPVPDRPGRDGHERRRVLAEPALDLLRPRGLPSCASSGS